MAFALRTAPLAFAGKPYSPPNDSKEYKSAVAAAVGEYEKRFTRRPKMEVRRVVVEDNWAGIYIKAQSTEDDYDLWLAVLRRSGSKWKVAGAFRTKDISKGDNPYDRLMTKFPDIPKAVRDALEVQ